MLQWSSLHQNGILVLPGLPPRAAELESAVVQARILLGSRQLKRPVQPRRLSLDERVPVARRAL